jgi:hypothetical protein
MSNISTRIPVFILSENFSLVHLSVSNQSMNALLESTKDQILASVRYAQRYPQLSFLIEAECNVCLTFAHHTTYRDTSASTERPNSALR